jgi:hypothetical protein
VTRSRLSDAAQKIRGRRRPAGGSVLPPLEPVFLRMPSGRVGSTLAMQLLATDPAIAFTRAYPYEARRVAALLWYARALAGPQPVPADDWAFDPDRLWWIDPAELGSRTEGNPLPYGPDGEARAQFHRDAVAALWTAFTGSQRTEHPGARIYVEKYAGFHEDLVAAGIPVRFVDIVRDPRDVWASIRAFDAQRGFYGFGRLEDQTEADYLRAFADAIGQRLTQILGGTPDCAQLTLRYEELAVDTPATAERLGRWLGASLDAAPVEEGREGLRHHMTTENVEASIGRWRRDVPDAEVAVLEDLLGEHMAALGYTA